MLILFGDAAGVGREIEALEVARAYHSASFRNIISLSQSGSATCSPIRTRGLSALRRRYMESSWSYALWRQFDAAIDMFEHALVACPDSLWTERLWPDPPPPWFPLQFSEFWFVSYHTLVWLDLYLSGVPEEEFAPPAPFAQGEIDSVEAMPARPYTKEELGAYLASLRQSCQTTLVALTDEQASRPVEYPWSKGQPISFLELQLYNLRHVQEHAAQLSLFLGQHGISEADIGWVARTKNDPGSR